MDRAFVAFLLFYAAPMIYGTCPTDQPPRFTLEPQDAVLPTVSSGNNPVSASIHCTHETPDTNLTWYRNGVVVTYDTTRILHSNGTLEFRPLIDRADVSVEGVGYQCRLSNAFGSVISRTALLQSATFGTQWNIADAATSMVDVTMGSFILLPCDPPAANPPPNVEWTLDGTVLVPGDTSKYKVLSPEAGGGLIIASVVAADIGPEYRCRVTNAFVFSSRNSPFTYQLNRIDSYSENFTIYDTIESVYTLPTGSNAEFTCLALANNVDDLEFLYRRIDGGTIPRNVIRTSHDATTIVGRTTMKITGVTQANAGEYQCLVRNVNTQGDAIALGNRNFTIQVSVAPAITSVPGDQILYTGDDYTLNCGATGFPAPMISYYFNATLITTGVSNGELTLTSVTAANTGPYQCFADNVRADSSALWIIRVRNPTAPMMMAVSVASTNVPENAIIVLSINVSADPAPIATWQLNGGDLPSTATAALNVINDKICPGTYQAVLTVTGFTEAHSGTYSVTVMNIAGDITHSFQRILEVPATVSSLTGIGTENKCITEGVDSMLTCTYGGVPPSTVLWYALSGDSRRNIPVSDVEYVVDAISATETQLTIRNVAAENDVTYGCEATNTVNGSMVMEKIELDIDICSMPAISPSLANTDATDMDEVVFTCDGTGKPAITYEWFYTNNSDVTVQVNAMTIEELMLNIMLSDDLTTITINEVTEDDEGMYTCQVTTTLGKVNRTATLTVNAPPTTEPPTTPRPKDNEDFPLYVIIVIGAGGAVIILIFILLICCAGRYYVRSKSYSVTNGIPRGGGRDEEDDDQPYNPQYESLPAPRPMKPPEYKPTPEYPSSSVITSRTPVPYNGSSSMMEMQKVSNTDLSKGNMYNYNSTSALTKQDMIDGIHQPRYEDFLSSDGQFV